MRTSEAFIPAIQTFKKYYWPLRLLRDKSSHLFYPDSPEVMVTWNYGKRYGREDTVIEVGARRGLSTEFLAKNTKMVYSFEPFLPNFLATTKRVSGYRNVKVARCALDNFVGTAELYGNSFIDGSPSLYGTRGYNKSFSVDVRRLDDFNLSASVLISDCEGAEIGLLKGGSSTLRNIKTAVIEVHPFNGGSTRSEVERILASSGFSVSFFPGYTRYIGPYVKMCEPFLLAQKTAK
jgi:FkbM family methyltransferase